MKDDIPLLSSRRFCRRRLQPVAGAAGATFPSKLPLRGTRPAKAGAYEIPYVSLCKGLLGKEGNVIC